MGKYVCERYFEDDDKNNSILAPFIDCHGPGRTVSGKPNIHNGSINNAKQLSIDVSFNTSSL